MGLEALLSTGNGVLDQSHRNLEGECMIKLRNMRSFAQWLMVLAIMALLFSACGGKEEPATKPGAKPALAAKAAKKAVEKGAEPEPEAGLAPATLDVLQLMPESAMIAMALPHLNGLVEKSVALAKRVAPDEIDIDSVVADGIAEMAEVLGVSDAETLGDIASAKGFDLDAPLAVFVDLGPTVAKLAEAAEALKPKAPEGEAPEGEATEEEAAEESESAKPTPAATFDQAEKMNALMAEMSPPGIVGVVACTDTALAETTLKEILASEGSPLTGAEVEDLDADGVTIHCYDPEMFSYFVSGNLVIGGTSLDMVKATAARLKDPAKIRYGTADCPAAASDELVELARLDKLVPLVESLLPVVEVVDPLMAPMMKAQAAMMKQVTAAYSGADPAVLTLAMDEDKVEFLTRIDMEAHPQLKALTGDASPLRLATLLPETTQLFLSMRFNEETKTNINNNLNALPSDVVPQQVSSMLPQFIQMIGDELTIAMIGIEEQVPKAILMLGMGDPENTKAMLQMFVPMSLTETYKEVEINSVAMPLPVQLSIAFAKDIVLLATDMEAMKGILDLLEAGKSSTLFASLDPPLDAAVPRYSALVLKTEMIAQVVSEVAALRGDLPPEVSMVINIVTDLVREVRMTQELVGGWQCGALTIHLNPAS